MGDIAVLRNLGWNIGLSNSRQVGYLDIQGHRGEQASMVSKDMNFGWSLVVIGGRGQDIQEPSGCAEGFWK